MFAGDLLTSSGAWPLTRGTTITDSMPPVIQRRHLADPIVHDTSIRQVERPRQPRAR